MACLHFYIPNQASSHLLSIPNHHNPKPATFHSSISLPSSTSFPKSPTTIPSRRVFRHKSHLNRGIIRASSETMATEKLGIKIVKNPPESKLTDLGVRSWPKWGCPPSKFPWTYSAKETCYLLKGKVKVYPEGSDEGVEIGAGDLVEFPKGMNCTWDVSETVDKHYNFE